MNRNINIFYYAPKELTTDAFLTWLLFYLDSDPKYSEAKQLFFDKIILKSEDFGKQVKDITVKRQENNVDVLLSFTFSKTGNKATVLFEDKTWSTHHGDQLKKYHTLYPNCYRYIYFKLAYVNFQEKQDVIKKGYDIVSAEPICEVLKEIVSIHPLIDMYYNYVNDVFDEKTKSFHDELFVKNNYNVLWNAEAQKYLCDIIAQNMQEQNVKYYEIRNGSSYGRPWTQIDIALSDNGYRERLFWRVDIRTGKFYIRLNQYSEPTKEQLELKKLRLNTLRNRISAILSDMPNIKSGKTNDKGVKECEVAIFFLQENDLDELIRAVPIITQKIVDIFKKMN